METIYLIQVEWTWFQEKQLNHAVLYAVRDEITAKEDCKRFQAEYNRTLKGSEDNCYGERRYYYEKIDLYTF